MPTTLFALLLKTSGMNQPEAAKLFDRSTDCIKSWSSGRNPTPQRVLVKMVDLIEQIDTTATQQLGDGTTSPAIVHLRPCDDEEYIRTLGWSSSGAYHQTLGLAAYRAIQAGHIVKIFPLDQGR